VAGIQGAGHSLLSGAFTGDRASIGGRYPRRLRQRLPSALACFEDDFEACIAHLRLPVTHRRFARTTNLLERLFVEERRRLKIIPNGFGEKPVLKLMFGALIRAAERWRGLRFTEFELRQIAAVRKELDDEYQASVTPLARSSQPRVSSKSKP
jgi:transposase-like protein